MLRPSAVFLWTAVAVAVTLGLTTFLLLVSDGANPERLGGLLDIVRIGLSVGAGTGGLFALWLATRRQRSAEQSLALQHEVSTTTVVDSTERRITEQYNKAIEQLGHEKAAVRLGAIYSLERIAQEHPGHRQTIVDVFCSYLRLPYEPPADREKKWAKSGAAPSPQATERLAELEVRYTIQGMFWEHLADPEKREVGEKCWADMDLDLSRTTLVDPILRHLAVRTLKSQHTVVYGIADFRGLKVTGIAAFYSAQFHGPAIFAGAVFSRGVALINSEFKAGMDLSHTDSSEQLVLTNSHFHGQVDLSGHSSCTIGVFKCQFAHDLVLRGATCRLVFVSESDFQGTFSTEGLDVETGSLTACSFRTRPDRHPKIVLIDDMSDRNRVLRSVAAHFGVELDQEL